MDVKKLLLGQNWEAEIERAFSEVNGNPPINHRSEK